MDCKQRAAALPNSPTLLQLWDALGSKLIEATQGQVPSKQRVVGSNPARDASLATIQSYPILQSLGKKLVEKELLIAQSDLSDAKACFDNQRYKWSTIQAY